MSSRTSLAVVSFALLAALAVAPARAQSEKLDLRLRLRQGEVYKVRVTVDQHITQKPRSNAQATDQTFAVTYRMSVDNVDAEGNMRAATVYDSVLFRQKGPAGAVEYDSTKPTDHVPQAARPFAALVGLGFTVTLAPDGKVTAVEGLDAMFAELLRKLELADGPTKAAVQKVLTEQFGQEAMKQNLQSMFAMYPRMPVAVGESWQSRAVVSKGFPVIIEGTYTLRSRADGVARIAVEASISPNEAAGPVEVGTGKMSYDLKGTETGTAEVDEATGWTRSLSTEQNVVGSLKFQGSGGADLNNPISIRQKVTLETVK